MCGIFMAQEKKTSGGLRSSLRRTTRSAAIRNRVEGRSKDGRRFLKQDKTKAFPDSCKEGKGKAAKSRLPRENRTKQIDNVTPASHREFFHN